MKKIGLLGAGMIGRIIALDLARNFDVTSIDISGASLRSESRSFGNLNAS